jgi:hypothetical protein
MVYWETGSILIVVKMVKPVVQLELLEQIVLGAEPRLPFLLELAVDLLVLLPLKAQVEMLPVLD